jgi:hypothetical protein
VLDNEGRFAIVTNVERGRRWTLLVRETNAPASGRRSRVVLMPRRRHQAGDDCFGSRAGDGDNKPDRRGEHEISRNTIVQGMPESSGGPVVTTFVWFFLYHAKLRASLTPGIPCALSCQRDDDDA